MIISNIQNLSSMSTVKAKVDLYNGSTLVKACTCGEVLSDFTVTRDGDNNKFFGFGICHKLDVNLIDFDKELLSVTVGNTAEIGLGNGTVWDTPYPTFYIQEIQRDEKANTVKVTAYDKLYEASEYSFDDLGLVLPYSFVDIAQAIATKLGLTLKIDTNIYSAFSLECLEDPNLDEASTKDLRSVLTWLAEATQSIYFINHLNELVFKRLDKNGAAITRITQNDYYELDTKTSKTITSICNMTELGDNLKTSIEGEGVTQYIRSNPFIELRDDITTILDAGIAAVGGLTITQFDCEWAGNYLLEPGDKLALVTKDGTEFYSYLISDAVTYDGTLNENSGWEYTEQNTDTFANPTNLGERLNQTFAKVDKIEKNITLQVSGVVKTLADEIIPQKIESLTGGLVSDVEELKGSQTTTQATLSELQLTTEGITQTVSKTEETLIEIDTTVEDNTALIQVNTNNISALQVKSNSISASVQTIQETTTTSLNNLHEEVNTLSNKVEAQITSEEVSLQISEALSNGVDSVTTSTGFTFDKDGLHISKSESDMESLLDDKGLEVSRYDTPVLTAKSDGVNALNITVRKFLNVGGSRFEKYGYNRTGCYWTGG